jgi:hypothetical protein
VGHNRKPLTQPESRSKLLWCTASPSRLERLRRKRQRHRTRGPGAICHGSSLSRYASTNFSLWRLTAEQQSGDGPDETGSQPVRAASFAACVRPSFRTAPLREN